MNLDPLMTDESSRAEIDQKPTMGGVLEEVRKRPNILKRLRMKLVVVNPTTAGEQREKMKLIIEHQSKLPSKLREAIQGVVEQNESPEVFLSKVYKATTAFFFGQPYRIDDEDENEGNEDEGTVLPSDWWRGLDFEVDTEEEAELAIRFFPNVLTEEYTSQSSSMRGSHPIYILMTSSKALPFVPLLAELGVDLGLFTEKQRGGLGCTFRGVFFQLVCNTIRKDKFEDEESGKLDEVSTAIMMQLKEKGLMKKEDIFNHNLVNLLLYKAVYNDKIFIEKRFRFLIDWDPYILMECVSSSYLLYHFVRLLGATNDGHIPPGNLQKFRLIFELGLLYFPSEIGFVFHKNKFYRSTFSLACEKFGAEPITQLIDDEISNYLKQNKNRQHDMIFSAASNDEISLDGFYILFRRDPIGIMSKLSKGN